MIQILFLFSDWAFFFLRIVLGVIFLMHGVPKLMHQEKTAVLFSRMGFKPGVFWGFLVSVFETIGGFMLLIGLFTQLSAFVLCLQMIVAVFWKIRTGKKFVGGYEFDILLVFSLFLLAIEGSSFLALDSFLNLYLFLGI